ncbi:tetratricopeptide repeat protein [Aestuariibacter sp. A3R04]|uniref:tetratricopeptide repeat protein n=1 Tax=Aestuariibacter sp. A3R04 TaxID=2841571 RepID=UPI001C09DE54|nr:tetratricopeptide repeat protein [Aestuariibacter sp. A3R04]MBU3024005.1 tetratricopeptide repeat protein [Aestuariibacter sp. A3R04]
MLGRNLNYKLLIILPVLTLFGCQSTDYTVSETEKLLSDKTFPDYKLVTIEQPDEIFELDRAARAFVDSTQLKTKTENENLKNLVRQIFDHSEHGLRYKSDANSVASETFANQAANCLSLTIMTYAMAKHAGFDATFYEVEIPEYWTRREGVNLLNGHINLRISLQNNSKKNQMSDDYIDVDFDPQAIRDDFHRYAVGKNEVIAMFYNNKGADALLAGNDTLAYAYFKEAASFYDKFGSTWVNLGVLYRRMGQFELAQASYENAIALDEDNYTAWENLSLLFRLQGKEEAAEDIRRKVIARREANPFYHFILGEEALDYGKPDEAIVHFNRARRLDRNRHEILFGLGKAHLELGDIAKAKKFIELAAKHAIDTQDEYRYLSKVSTLQSAL